MVNFEEKNVFEMLNLYVDENRKRVSASGCSVLVMRHNKILNEFYSGYHDKSIHSRKIDKDSQFNIASIRKTYLGLAISLALYEGKIGSIDDYVRDYLEDVSEGTLNHITIRHILTHTHGLLSIYESDFPPGTGWTYNNVGVNLLFRVVERVFNQSFAKVLRDRVFTPCEMKATDWQIKQHNRLVWTGETYTSNLGDQGNLFTTTRDLAKWGELYLNKGMYKGKQILPHIVFEQAISILTPSSLEDTLPRNGFFWWIKDKHRPNSELGHELPIGSYQSLGIYGNVVLVIPEYDVVAIRMVNQLEANPPDYDYINDVQTFGNLVMQSVLLEQCE